MSKPLNDELQIHISVKWAVQILFFVFTLTGAWYTLNANINSNAQEIEHIKENARDYVENFKKYKK